MNGSQNKSDSTVVVAMAERLLALPVLAKMILVSATDFAVVFVIVFLVLSAGLLPRFSDTLTYVPASLIAASFTVIGLILCGAYRTLVRFLDASTLIRVSMGAAVSLSFWALLYDAVSQTDLIPLQIALIVTATVSGLSFVRALAHRALRPGRVQNATAEKVIIYGAGSAGAQLATALEISGKFKPILFVDDSRSLQGRTLKGYPILSPDSIEKTCERKGVTRLLLAIPSIGRVGRNEILRNLEDLPLKVMVIPGMDEIAKGDHKIDDLREVQIEDLLSRDPVAPDEALMHQNIREKRVLITGAGGSIGSELCRQAVALGSHVLVLFEQNEFALYNILSELGPKAATSGCQLVPIMGSVADKGLLYATLVENSVQTVYHAAAYKHVPLVESNPCAGIANNVFGTQNAAEAAIDAKVENFVLVSTDKAVRPTNVMGASKRVCELVLQALAAQRPGTRMSMVRFGNVLGSSGSVVPLFREQIKAGGPITVTHPEVTRYFMTIPEAAQLVIQAGAMGGRGEVFVLEMGEPVLIRHLAERMIHLSGLEVKSDEHPAGHIAIEYSGLRPGEKLFEELLIADNPQKTTHSRIFQAEESYLQWDELQNALNVLQKAIDGRDAIRSRLILVDLVAGYHGGDAITMMKTTDRMTAYESV